MDNTPRPMWSVYTANPFQDGRPVNLFYGHYASEQKAQDVTREFRRAGHQARYRESTPNSEWRQ